MQKKLLVIISVDFNITDQILIIYSAFVKYLRKNGNKTKQCINYNFKKAYDSVSGRSFITFSFSMVSP